MNALAVGSSYLEATDRVLLIDRRHRAGGMWVDTYPYVRLHQPHPFFTAGDIGWQSGEDRAHLATKHEVLDHFIHCLEVVRGRVQLDEWHDTDYVSHDASNGTVEITTRTEDGRVRIARARRLVKATGLDIRTLDPLQVSSTSVHSVSPDSCDVRSGDIADSNAPVWIIGGGKTAMDTACALIAGNPAREVNMLVGTGTFFFERDRAFPTGAKRYVGGQRGFTVFRDWADRFDGTNETEVMRWFPDAQGIAVTPTVEHFLFGLLSRAEAETIRNGLTHPVMDHLTDVVDGDGSVEMSLRSGATRQIEEGSWLVNCTGYILGREPLTYEPYTSADGRVATITPTSSIMWLTSMDSYFATHLLMLDKLATVPLYELDADSPARQNRDARACAMTAVSMYNQCVLFDHVPREVFTRNGLDFEKWFPAHRQLLSNPEFMKCRKELRAHTGAALDRVQARFDVRCGPVRQPATVA
ncbi:hypothetical protein LP418_07245 [Nocardioides sp. B-3]|nr:hypothetical protein LP418_07245 [Nocardioides sp. B-3]